MNEFIFDTSSDNDTGFENRGYDSNVEAGKILSDLFAYLQKTYPQLGWCIKAELERHRNTLDLIASENYLSLQSNLALASLLTIKYAEGFADHRFYGGCEIVDIIEHEAEEAAKQLFDVEAAFVQPDSGSSANLIAVSALLYQLVMVPFCKQHTQTASLNALSYERFKELRHLMIDLKLLSLSLEDGGHITHGFRINRIGQMFDVVHYKVDPKIGLDYDAIEAQALDIKPFIMIAGFSAYPKAINFKRMREIADKSGAILLVDMAHIAGLIAGKVLTGDFNPTKHADIITSTTHKTLRGPRGGLILASNKYIGSIRKACPLVMGGPCLHSIAAKYVSFKEALSPQFQEYAHNVVLNAKSMVGVFLSLGLDVVYGTTDTHIILLDLTSLNISGQEAEDILGSIGIICNKNVVPKDRRSFRETSGIRIGTAAITARGFKLTESIAAAKIIGAALLKTTPLSNLKMQLQQILNTIPLYPNIHVTSENTLFAVDNFLDHNNHSSKN